MSATEQCAVVPIVASCCCTMADSDSDAKRQQDLTSSKRNGNQ
jgi:hypothetical protein